MEKTETIMKDGNEETKVEKAQPIRDTLYGRIDVSLKGMDRFIIIMLILLVSSIILGVVL